MTFLKKKKNLAYMWVLTDKFYKSSPNSKYRLNFLSAPFAIYSRVSAALHGCQRPKMWRLFLRAMLPVSPPPPPRSLLSVEDLWAVQCCFTAWQSFGAKVHSATILFPSTYGKQTFRQMWGYLVIKRSNFGRKKSCDMFIQRQQRHIHAVYI